MFLFYKANITSEFVLDAEESRHLTKVLRKREGEDINLTDGKGILYVAQILEIGKQQTKLKVVTSTEMEMPKNHLHIAISPTKNMTRFEWFLEKATEIGIQEITPLICKRTERTRFNMDRSEKILITAMKQSLRYHLPIINEPVTVPALIDKIKNDDQIHKWIASYKEDNPDLKEVSQNVSSALLLIGPEGDFTEGELQLTKDNSFQCVNLHNYRLRTETAGIVGCHIFNLSN